MARRSLRVWFAAALTGFVVVAWWALSGLSAHTDQVVTAWAVSARRPWLTVLAWPVTHAGGTAGLTVATALTACGLWLVDGTGRQGAQPWWWRGAYVAGTMASSACATVLIKELVGRSRPGTHLLLGQAASSYSFPSGHSFNTGVFTLTVAVVLTLGARRWRGWLWAWVALTTAVVGLTRIYLAYHWLTDVLAGWCLAVAWVAATALVAGGAHRADASGPRAAPPTPGTQA